MNDVQLERISLESCTANAEPVPMDRRLSDLKRIQSSCGEDRSDGEFARQHQRDRRVVQSSRFKEGECAFVFGLNAWCSRCITSCREDFIDDAAVIEHASARADSREGHRRRMLITSIRTRTEGHPTGFPWRDQSRISEFAI